MLIRWVREKLTKSYSIRVMHYAGGYPAGLLESAREILVRGDMEASIWHIPGGCADTYNRCGLWGYGKNDKRIDINPAVKPDILFDVRRLKTCDFRKWPENGEEYVLFPTDEELPRPDAVIIDRDYSRADADELHPESGGASTWPDDLEELTRQCLRIVKSGGYVGVLDEISPRLSKDYVKAYQIPVMVPDGNRPRLFTVWRGRAR